MAAEREALVVGIDHYEHEEQLGCCVADATAIADVLASNGDGSDNWITHTLLSTEFEPVTRIKLREALVDLFEESEGLDLLFYFSGHGGLSALGPELFTSDGVPPSSFGVSMHEIALVAQQSMAESVTIILDCCAAGTFGDATLEPSDFDTVTLRSGVSLMAACRATEEAEEIAPHGVFTQLLLEGVRGAAADIHGRVTTLGLHALASAAFPADGDQHPVLKAHSIDGPVLRQVAPLVETDRLARLRAHFAAPDTGITLTGDMAVDLSPVGTNDAGAEHMADLRAYLAANLVKGVMQESVAALRLTPLGQHYWRTCG